MQSKKRKNAGLARWGGKLYVVGGRCGGSLVSSVDCFDLDNVGAVWTAMPSMQARRASVGVACWEGKLYAVGGRGRRRDLKLVECLDLKNVCAGWMIMPSMKSRKRNVGVACWGEKLYAVGTEVSHTRGHFKSVECLDLKNVGAGWKGATLPRYVTNTMLWYRANPLSTISTDYTDEDTSDGSSDEGFCANYPF